MPRLSDRVALFALATLTAAGVVSVAARWGAKAEYADRFLILLGAGWAAVRAWPTAPSRPTPASAACGLLLVAAASLAFPVAWLLQVQAGPRTVLLWWQCAAVSAAAAGALLVRHGGRKVRACGFALLFPFLALPIPDRVLVPLQHGLQVVTTTAAQGLLSPLFTVKRPGGGFLLELPGGPLEVAEACSGVRSLTALVAIAAFVAFLRGFGPVGGGLLVALSIPAVAATNVLRVFLSGLIQETFGAAYIQGDWHEALGLVMVLVGLAGILALASALGKLATPWEAVENIGPHPVASQPPSPSETVTFGDGGRGLKTSQPDSSSVVAPPLPPSPEVTVSEGEGPGVRADHPPERVARSFRSHVLNWVVAVLLLASAVGTAYAVRLGWLAVEESVAKVPLDRIPLRLGDWTASRDEPIPAYVTDRLVQDVGLYRVYATNLGQEVHCWVMYWSSLSAVRGYHHPDVCWGKRGGRTTFAGVVAVEPPGGGTLPLTARKFDLDGGQQFILYWTQDGRQVWDDATEAEASVTGGFGARSESGTAWVADLLTPPAARPPGRLTVVLATRHVGPTAEREATDLARRLAGEIYTLCPWAGPPRPLASPPP